MILGCFKEGSKTIEGPTGAHGIGRVLSCTLIVKAFTVLMLTCVICLLGFLGFWWWYRGICNRLYTECRNWLMALRKPHHAPDDVQNQGVSLYPLMTSHPDEEQIVNFPRTSA